MDDSYILHSTSSIPTTLASASGSRLRLENGVELLDACSGVGVACLGYNNAEVIAAIKAQLDVFSYTYSGAFSNAPADLLAKELVHGQAGTLCKAVFFSSGSEALEAALKIAVQYWRECGLSRTKFIARRYSYHGSTLGALSISGHTDRREPYLGYLADNVTFVDACYPFRKPEDQSEEEYVAELKQQLDKEIQRIGPDSVAAFVAETIPATTIGCVPASKGYFRAVREVCDRYGVLLILDEVFCGLGRSGSYHAWQQEDGFVGPDLQAVSKGLAAGYIPLSAVLVNKKVVNQLRQNSAVLKHSQTFQGHPLACAAALQVQRIVKRPETSSNVVAMGEVMERALHKLISPLPMVANVRGRGLLWGIEFDCQDKIGGINGATPADSLVAPAVVRAARKEGLYIHGASGRSEPAAVDYVLLAPWFFSTEAEIIITVHKLRKAIETVCDAQHIVEMCYLS